MQVMFVPADSKEQIILVVKSAKMLDNLNSSFYESSTIVKNNSC